MNDQPSAQLRTPFERARAEGRHRFKHAFPSVTNPPSNAICRKLGFTLKGELDFEYRRLPRPVLS
jgi:RimJ/RimL family protein N-acetyltransferase